jgi:hypothetical protein
MHDPRILRYTLLASGVAGLLFGLLFFLAPDQSIRSLEAGAPTVPALLFARSTGALILGVSIANLLAAFDRGSPALRALVVGNIAVHVLSDWADFSEGYARNAGVWAGIAVHVVLIAAFTYCLIHWRQMFPRG